MYVLTHLIQVVYGSDWWKMINRIKYFFKLRFSKEPFFIMQRDINRKFNLLATHKVVSSVVTRYGTFICIRKKRLIDRVLK